MVDGAQRDPRRVSTFLPVIGWVMAPKLIQVLTPGTRKCCIWQKQFWGCDLEMGRLYCRRESLEMEAEGSRIREKRCDTAGCEDGGRSCEPRNLRHVTLEAGKSKEMNSPLEPSKGVCWHCDFPSQKLICVVTNFVITCYSSNQKLVCPCKEN